MKTICNLFIICFLSINIVSCGGASDNKAIAESEIQEEKSQIQEDSKKAEEAPAQETPEQVQETHEQIEAENVWETLEFKNYSIDYPKNRRLVINSPEGNFTLYLLTGQTDNVMMKINDLAGYMLTLDSYSFQFYDEYFRRTNVTLLEDKTITINKQPCHKFVATADDGHGEIEYKTMVYIWVKNNWAYNLIFSAKPDKYDELKPIAQKVADSFKLSK